MRRWGSRVVSLWGLQAHPKRAEPGTVAGLAHRWARGTAMVPGSPLPLAGLGPESPKSLAQKKEWATARG